MQEVEDGISAMQQDNKESRLVLSVGSPEAPLCSCHRNTSYYAENNFSVITVSQFAFFSKNKDMIFEI